MTTLALPENPDYNQTNSSKSKNLEEINIVTRLNRHRNMRLGPRLSC